MRFLVLTIFASLTLSFQTKAQIQFPVEFSVEKQAMSTPMSDVEDILFLKSYYARPVNIELNGEKLAMVYQNGEVFTKKNLTKVDYEVEYDGDAVSMETYYYKDNANNTDDVLFVVDYSVGYLEVVLTTKNSKGENIGYTSYRQYVSGNELALK